MSEKRCWRNDNDIDDESLTDLTGSVTILGKLTNNFDDSFVMDNLLIHQNSSSITEYVEDFMHVKNQANFIFKRDFNDNHLVYYFVNGFKEEIREALQMLAPELYRGQLLWLKFSGLIAWRVIVCLCYVYWKWS